MCSVINPLRFVHSWTRDLDVSAYRNGKFPMEDEKL